MERIFDNIGRNSVCDSEIIQDIERIPGFDINLGYGEIDWSSLMWAVGLDRKELVRYLLSDSSINVNHRSNQGNTALHFCEDISILKLLLCHRDIDVNIQDNNNGWIVLHRACYNNRIGFVRDLLLDARINIIIRTNRGETARDIAREYCTDIANMLKMVQYTPLLRIPNDALCRDIVRMIIEEYT